MTAEGAAAVAANREAIDHLQSALDLATRHPGTAERADIQHLKLKLAGLHFLVEER